MDLNERAMPVFIVPLLKGKARFMFELIKKRTNNVRNEVTSGITVALALVPEAVAFSFVEQDSTLW